MNDSLLFLAAQVSETRTSSGHQSHRSSVSSTNRSDNQRCNPVSSASPIPTTLPTVSVIDDRLVETHIHLSDVSKSVLDTFA